MGVLDYINGNVSIGLTTSRRISLATCAYNAVVSSSPVLLERLRAWWKFAHAQGKMLPGGWLFSGLDPINPLSTRQLTRAVHAAAEAAGIDKRVSMHTLRHNLEYRIMPSNV